LCREVEAVCNDAKPLSAARTVDSKKRNRHETRTVAVFDAQPAVRGTEWQPHVKAIIVVERRVLTFKPASGLWNSSSECSFYLSNRPILASQAADAIRKHWGIENKQHCETRRVLCAALGGTLRARFHRDSRMGVARRGRSVACQSDDGGKHDKATMTWE
jgi:hypothetical protein